MGIPRLLLLRRLLFLPQRLPWRLLMRWQRRLQLRTLKRPRLARELQGQLRDQIMAARRRRTDGQE